MNKVLLLAFVVVFTGTPVLPRVGNASPPPSPDHLIGSWSTETIAPGPGVGNPNSIALTSDRGIYVAYIDYLNRDLMIARNLGSGWHASPVRSSGLYGGSVSLAIDSHDFPHIAYCELLSTMNPICDELWYTWDDGGGWMHQVLDDSGGAPEEVGASASLALDSNDWAHVTYYVSTTQDLRYVFWNRSDPPANTIFSTLGEVESGSSLRVWDDYPHIAFKNDAGLKYMHKMSPYSWILYDAANGGGAGYAPSLGRCEHSDGEDEIYIAYYDATQYKVMMARRTGITWQSEEIESTFLYGNIAFQVHGTDTCSLEVVFFNSQAPTKLRYYARSTAPGSTWMGQDIDQVSDAGPWWVSLALELNGQPHISYFYLDETSLRHATKLFHLALPLVLTHP